MIGNTNINQINSRLNQIYQTLGQNDYFGNKNILFFGDLHQIQPVQQSRIFDPRGSAKLSLNLWKELVTYDELTDIVRSKEDQPFTEMCHRLREGKQTPDDIALLQSRVLSVRPEPHEMMDSMALFATNAECNSHNNACIEHLRKTIYIEKLIAHDKFGGESEMFNNQSLPSKHDKKNISDYMSNDINKTAGLPTALYIGVGARVMVRVNIDVVDKLVNGQTGTVNSVKYVNLF